MHRVVRLDISDAVFEPKTSEMRPQWAPRDRHPDRGTEEGAVDPASVVPGRRRGGRGSSSIASNVVKREIVAKLGARPAAATR
ncbi:MAG: hypothetical protein MZV70_41600 [Desulfobacterales bacterium]|nr:hypothetical protein [Desulfobacterales bacterium]